jgi:activating signal cointegrator 1
VRVLSVRQPWAGLIAAGVKAVETRPTAISYTGQIAIHAALRDPDVNDPATLAALRAAEGVRLDFGVVVGVVRLHGIVRVDRITWADTDLPWVSNGDGSAVVSTSERPLGDFSPGRWAWLLSNADPLDKPVRLRGRQGLRNLPPDVEELVAPQLGRRPS